MKCSLLAGILLLFITARSSTYYFSSSVGNDLRTALQARDSSSPWQSLDKLNSFFRDIQRGDSILFKRGDVFKGSLRIKASGNAAASIVFGAYGSGPEPVLTGLSVLTNWSFAGNGVWESNTTPQIAMLPSEGLTYKYFEGQWSRLPDFKKLVPRGKGIIKGVDLEARQQDDLFSILWEGEINIPVAGTYYFETYSDDGSKLYIGEYDSSANAVVDNDGSHAAQYAGGYYTFSTPGKYPIAVSYYNVYGGREMQVFWQCTAAGMPGRTVIPDSVFSHRGSDVSQLNYKYYEGTWNKMPDYKKQKTIVEGSASAVNINAKLLKTNYGYLWQGQIIIPAAGTYYFETNSDDGSRLYIGNYDSASLVVDNRLANNGQYAGGYHSFASAGLYPITVSYFQKAGSAYVNLYWTNLDAGIAARTPIPDSVIVTEGDQSKVGVSFRYYEGAWNALPNFDTLVPVSVGFADRIGVKEKNRTQQFGMVWEGKIYVPAAGNYYFETNSDDGSILQIGKYDSSGTYVLDNSLANNGQFAGGYFYFPSAGSYPLAVAYHQKSGSAILNLYWTCPEAGFAERTLIAKNYFSDNGEKSFNFLSAHSILLVNNQPVNVGRFPNTGYLNINSFTGNGIVSSTGLSTGPLWTNGEMVLRKNRWTLERNIIKNHSGNQLFFTSSNNYPLQNNFGFFIQNHVKTLDQLGEWYFDTARGRMMVYFGSNNPALYKVEVSEVENLIEIIGQKYIIVENIELQGSNTNSVLIRNADHIVIQTNKFNNAGVNAITGSDLTDISIQNNVVTNSQNNAIEIANCTGAVIMGNKISNTGTAAGMGKGSVGASYTAIDAVGKNLTIAYNSIDSTGYIPIGVYGDTFEIRNNYINNFCLVKDDGGGVYVFKGAKADTMSGNITGNIILKGIGAPQGTNAVAYRPVYGIYLDDNTHDVLLNNNSIAEMGDAGIYIHNGSSMTLDSNILFGNKMQLFVRNDNLAATQVRNLNVINNQFVAKSTTQTIASFESIIDSRLDSFGIFSNNIYDKPFSNQPAINTLRRSNNQNIYQMTDLTGWQQLSNRDISSNTGPLKLSPYSIDSYTSVNKYNNGSFNTNTSGLYIWSPNNNAAVSWNNTVLDTGSLKVSFSPSNSGSSGSLLISVGAVDSGTQYILQFSIAGNSNKRQLETYLRQSVGNYRTISDVKYFRAGPGRSEWEFLLSCNFTEPNAVVNINIPEQDSALWFDNVSLRSATTTPKNVDDYLRFEYNPTMAAKTISLDGTYVDPLNQIYYGTITLAPFTAVILIKQPLVGPAPAPAIITMQNNKQIQTGIDTIPFVTGKQVVGLGASSKMYLQAKPANTVL